MGRNTVRGLMHPFIVTLDRPTSGKTLADSQNSARSAVERFSQALRQLVSDEGLATDLGPMKPTANLPIIFLMGTDRLAQRIRGMRDVRSVARDSRLTLRAG